MRVLQKRLPKVDVSKSGHLILRWKEGMPLSEFLRYICR